MTQDEIIEMACQAFGGLIKQEERPNFMAFAKLVAEKERERIYAEQLGKETVEAIRARGEPTLRGEE